jgi:hypothetical protein
LTRIRPYPDHVPPKEGAEVAFLPADFVVPALVSGPDFRIRPVTVHDVVRVYEAAMTSRPRLWELFGAGFDWPADGMTLEQCLIDVAWQQKEAELRRSFAFAVFSTDETRLLGCIRLAQPTRVGTDAELTFWVSAANEVSGLETELADFIREWATTAWPFKDVRFPGRDLSWEDWKALPPVP